MQKAYKYRLYPTTKQRTMFAKTFGCVRFIYNKMLADKKQYYSEAGKSLSVTPAKYKTDYPWLKEVDSLALANAQLHLQIAYNNFFRDKSVGFPKFKSKKNHHHCYSTNNQKGSVRIENEKIKLPKIGFVKIRQHRPLPENSMIKTVTVSQESSGKYYISVLVEYENQILDIKPKTFLGLDFAMDGLYIDSNGSSADYPKFYRKALSKLAVLQRRLSHCKTGSKNRNRMRIKVARWQEHVANQRKDFQHKLSRKLVDLYDCVCIEDLDMQGMSKALNFGKSVMDNGWGMFVNMLAYKLAWQGKSLVKVDKWYPSSQLCSACGYKNEQTKDLSVREWLCPSCGIHHNRDHNSAINIMNEGKRLVFA